MSDSIFLTDGNGVITGLVDMSYAGELVIPEYVGDERIVGIAQGAFYARMITSVTISSSVVSIGRVSFCNCANLISVVIPNSVIEIGASAFDGCTSLTTVYVLDSNNISEAVSSYTWRDGVTFKQYVAPVDMFIKNTTLTNLANKIRILSGEENAMTPAEMGGELDEANNEVVVQGDMIEQMIDALGGKANGTVDPSGTISITENGTYDVTEFAEADVNVPTEAPALQNKTIRPAAIAQTVIADDGYDGLGSVIVEGDANLKSENIAEGTTIFGIPGSHVSGGAIDESELIRQSEIMDEILALLAEKNPELYPEGAFRVVSSLVDGKSYVLAFSYEGTMRYLTDTAFNDWTVQAANLSVQNNGDYVTFSGNPTRFTAAASGGGFTLTAAAGSLTGNASSGGTDLKVNTDAGTVFTVDTSENGGFSSGVYIPKSDARAVWLRANLNSQNCCLKYESGNNSVGIDYAGRDTTYSTGFVPFLLYELCEGEAMA